MLKANSVDYLVWVTFPSMNIVSIFSFPRGDSPCRGLPPSGCCFDCTCSCSQGISAGMEKGIQKTFTSFGTGEIDKE